MHGGLNRGLRGLNGLRRRGISEHGKVGLSRVDGKVAQNTPGREAGGWTVRRAREAREDSG